MTLAPRFPPGRANRKALQFAVDIHRLRDAGYTFSAIRLALLDAGVCVGLSTIKRERARKDIPVSRAAPVVLAQEPSPFDAARAAGPGALPLRPATPHRVHGHEIAEAFFAAHPSKPLLRNTQEIP